MWETAHWSAVIPSVLWHQARAEALHRVYGCCGMCPLLLLCCFFDLLTTILFSHIVFYLSLRAPLSQSLLSSLSLCDFSHGSCLNQAPIEQGIEKESKGLVFCLLLAVAQGDGWGGRRGWLATYTVCQKADPPLPTCTPPWGQARVRGRSPEWAGKHRPELVSRPLGVCEKGKQEIMLI